MRIMADSNVIVSAVYNQSSKTAAVFNHVCDNHELVLCGYNITECRDVVKRKFPQHLPVLNTLFMALSYELHDAQDTGSSIINPKDSPILNAAISAEVDIIVSGDKDFLSLNISRPAILSPTEYFDTYLAV